MQASTAGAMAAHGDLLYVIGTDGRIRTAIQSDPGNTAALESSLSTLVVTEVQRVLAL